ncbi:MAG: hypothetical protein ABIR70_21620 [Bryobacteraceae bacterium]
MKTTRLSRILIVAIAVAAALAATWALNHYSPKPLQIPPHNGLPETFVEDGRLVVRTPGSTLIADLARYDDELFAYMMFDYLRSRPTFAGSQVLLVPALEGEALAYRIKVLLPNDVLAAMPRLYDLGHQFPFLTPVMLVVDDRLVKIQRQQTDAFVRAYSFPAYTKLEHLATEEVVAYARRFIRFKSNTDPRIRRQIEPVPHPLSQEEAQSLAEDIVTIAEFYQLPLEFFLGIGAMENNYMNVKGDLGNAIWKRRAESGDIILRRSGSRVLVLNESEGLWQIGRETLRYVHRLYVQDKRDYSRLPDHLRPPRELDVEGLDKVVLTTYAGLLFRNLLDRFDGDVGTAVGAYNGGPGNPNAKYEAGVEVVARYARRVMEQAAALRSQRVASELQR